MNNYPYAKSVSDPAHPEHPAPDGKCWKCPDCDDWCTLEDNARAHRWSTGHAKAVLAPIPVEGLNRYDLDGYGHAATNVFRPQLDEIVWAAGMAYHNDGTAIGHLAAWRCGASDANWIVNDPNDPTWGPYAAEVAPRGHFVFGDGDYLIPAE